MELPNTQIHGGLAAPMELVSCGLPRAANGLGWTGLRAGGDSVEEAGGSCPQQFRARILHTDNRQSTALAYQVDTIHRTLGDLTFGEIDRICKEPFFASDMPRLQGRAGKRTDTRPLTLIFGLDGSTPKSLISRCLVLDSFHQSPTFPKRPHPAKVGPFQLQRLEFITFSFVSPSALFH